MQLESTYQNALRAVRTEYQLAKRLEVTQSVLTRRNEKPLSPELWALIADIAGENPSEALNAATIERNKGKPRGEWLQRALSKQAEKLRNSCLLDALRQAAYHIGAGRARPA